jgi:hypothetical protein
MDARVTASQSRQRSAAWLSDGHNERVHILDATVMPPKQVA